MKKPEEKIEKVICNEEDMTEYLKKLAKRWDYFYNMIK